MRLRLNALWRLSHDPLSYCASVCAHQEVGIVATEYHKLNMQISTPSYEIKCMKSDLSGPCRQKEFT